MSAALHDAARNWLASADPDPDHARRWWRYHPDGTAVIPLGTLFDAVEIPPQAGALLADAPEVRGPVLAYEPSCRLYVLVPPGASTAWSESRFQCLGSPHYVHVPDPARTSPADVYWLRAPDGHGTLTEPAALLGLLGRVFS